MTIRLSNARALTILPPEPIEGIGWTIRFVSENDYETVLAHTARWAEASFSDELSEVGAFAVVMDAEDPLWDLPLPAGESGEILDREVVVQFLYEGQVRFEGLLEDVQPDEVGADGHRKVRLSGRGMGALLERGIVLPEGMPAPLTLTREFTGPVMAGWLTLFQEAKARGVAEKIIPSFTATADTYLDPWPDSSNRVVNPGENLLTLLKSYTEAADLTWRVLPAYRSLVVASNYGQRLAGSVIFYQGRHILESDRKVTRREIATSVYAQGADYSLATASGNLAKWGLREKWVTTGGSGDVSTAQMVATAEARISGDEKISRTARVLFDSPGRKPFEDYKVGDWVGVETPSKAIAEVRIVAISVRLDEAGNAESEITLQTRFEAEEIRTRKALERLGAEGTSEAGGTVSVVQAVSSMVRLRDLVDVQAPTPSDGQFLEWDSGLGAWAPTSFSAAPIPRTLTVALSDETTAITAGTAKLTMRAPKAMTLTAIPRASLSTASTSGNPTVDIKVNGTSVLGAAKLSIDVAEKTSVTAATPTTLTTTAIADDAEITFDVTVAGTGAKGLKVTLYYLEA